MWSRRVAVGLVGTVLILGAARCSTRVSGEASAPPLRYEQCFRDGTCLMSDGSTVCLPYYICNHMTQEDGTR